ncbi:hypothetical protein [Burkholderia ubonensis]|uniref:hypothetical protein n=1 Tax=Burkholderia ubonensis TaxID=101571 RepID=UPI00075C4969|nr:hypothetical protein [Burkholderia ubonensis]KWK75907.1 hypothetical protein WM15_29380 [Burkholderia ubonensis]
MSSSVQLWHDLSPFEIEVSSQSALLYRNGRQQVKITVTLQPIGAELTEQERRSLKLINYRTSEVLAADGTSARWMQGTQFHGYDYFPERGRDEAGGLVGIATTAREYFDFYVSTLATAGESFQIGMQITRQDGAIVRSNNQHEGDYHSTHRESVTVTPVESPRLTQDEYEWKKERVLGSSGEWVFQYIDNYYLRAFYDRLRPVALRSMQVTPAGMIQWHDKSANETFASYTGYGEPGSEIVHYNSAIVLGGHRPHGTIIAPMTGWGVVALAADGNIPYHSGSANGHNGPCMITAIDAFGNAHTLRVRFESATDRHNLRIETV